MAHALERGGAGNVRVAVSGTSQNPSDYKLSVNQTIEIILNIHGPSADDVLAPGSSGVLGRNKLEKARKANDCLGVQQGLHLIPSAFSGVMLRDWASVPTAATSSADSFVGLLIFSVYVSSRDMNHNSCDFANCG